jgi:hypothetical protein
MFGQQNSGHNEIPLAFQSLSYTLIITVLSSVLCSILTSCHSYGPTLIFGCAAMKTLHVMTAVKDRVQNVIEKALSVSMFT